MKSLPLPATPDPAFEFVQMLAAELSKGSVDIPSFPEIAVRVRRVLADPTSSIEQVIRVVGSEPGLAVTLLRLANSALINRSGRPIADLRTAVNRIGYNMVRSAAISFALAQIREANRFSSLEGRLHALWERSALAAACAYVLARACTRINPDEALLAGLLHGIGTLYVLMRSTDHPGLSADGALLESIIKDWHCAIGRAILENWEFPPATSLAIGAQDEFGIARDAPADLSDVVAVALVMASHVNDAATLEIALAGRPAAARLALGEGTLRTLMLECAAEVAALKQALGD